MKSQFVNTLQEGDRVNDYFTVTRKDLRTKQDGGKFLGVVLKDRTGEMGGIMWNNAVDASRLFEAGDVLHVRGQVAVYQNRLQVRMESALPLREGEYTTEDLVFTPVDTQENFVRLKAILDTIQNPWLKKLLDAFWQDEAFMTRFSTAAAAKKWHHEFVGGLVRHCYEMACLAEALCALFPDVDRDILLAGVLLHDIGKLDEMSHEMFVDYTNEGKLLGHLQIGADMVMHKIRGIDGFPDELRLRLLHCILSHHGELQNGSPVTPKTIEAIALHHIDNLDAQTAAFTRIIQETRSRGQEWSDYMPLIDRVVWAK